MSTKAKLAILGTGNIGRAIGIGLVAADEYEAGEIILTRRQADLLEDLGDQGFQVRSDNKDAVQRADLLVVAVPPQDLNALLREIAKSLDSRRHRLISVVSGVSIEQIVEQIGTDLPVIRAMPNTAIEVSESMTCLAAREHDEEALAEAVRLFNAVGKTQVISEEQIVAATAVCACGMAFFLRIIRAAMQGGIQIGFHPHEALRMAAQTALGAATVVLSSDSHPEYELDRVTTPRGCTIVGLNEMEDRGVSPAMIRGIVASAEKAESLYAN